MHCGRPHLWSLSQPIRWPVVGHCDYSHSWARRRAQKPRHCFVRANYFAFNYADCGCILLFYHIFCSVVVLSWDTRTLYGIISSPRARNINFATEGIKILLFRCDGELSIIMRQNNEYACSANSIPERSETFTEISLWCRRRRGEMCQ